jgi:hypothetical protein
VEESDAWTIEELLALMVPIGTASDGRRSWPSMGELSIGSVDTLLGVDRVLDALPQDLPSLTHDSDFERRRAQVSLEEGRRYALAVMGRAREQRIEQRDVDRREEKSAATDNPQEGSAAQPGSAEPSDQNNAD